MEIRTEFLIGKQKVNEWPVVYGYRQEDVMNSAELFAVMRIASGSEDVELERIAKLLLDELQFNFFESNDTKQKDNIIKLEDAVWKLKSRMDLILSREVEVAKNGVDIEVAIVVIEKHFLYAAIVGESKIYIKRGDAFVDISKGLIDANMMGFLKSGSLELEREDRICLATSKCSELGTESIDLALSNLDINKLTHLKEQYGAAALLLAEKNLPWIDPKEEIVLADKVEEEPITEEINADAFVHEGPMDVGMEEGIDKSIDSGMKPENMDSENTDTDGSVSENSNEVEEKSRETMQAVKTNISKFGSGLSERISMLKVNAQKKLDERKQAKAVAANIEGNDINDEMSNSQYDEALEEEEKSGTAFDNVKVILTKIGKGAKALWLTKILPLFKNNKTYAKVLRDIGNKIMQIIKKLVELFKKEIIGTGDRRDLYLKAKRRKRSRILLVIGIIILVIILIVVINKRNAAIKEQDRVDTAKAATLNLKNKLDTLTGEVNNSKSADDKTKTGLLTQLNTLSSDIDSQKSSGLLLDELDQYKQSVQEDKDSLQSIFAFTQPQVITDVGKLYADANLTDIVYTNGNIYISDAGRNVVYKVAPSINSQLSDFVTGLTQPQVIVVDSNGDIIVYDNDAGSNIGKISTSSGQFTRLQGLSSAVIGKITDAAIYSGNNALYEIHQNHQQIFKRQNLGDTYDVGGAVYQTDNPPNWKTDPELKDAIDIAAPYEIYVLIKDKGLRRYLGGDGNTISFSTFTNLMQKDYDSFANATAMDVSDNYMVIGDSTNQRVMIFNVQNNDQKTLTFVKQYVYRGDDTSIFKNIKKVTIDEANKSTYILDGSKVVRLDL